MAPKAEDGGFTAFKSVKNDGDFRVTYERGVSPGSVRIRIWDAQDHEYEARVVIRDPNYLQTLLEAVYDVLDVWEKVVVWPDGQMRKITLLGLYETGVLSKRVWNMTHRADMRTLDDVCQHSPKELLALPGFGDTALDEIRSILAPWNLRLANDDEGWYEKHKEEDSDAE
jgi:hypothetical protein